MAGSRNLARFQYSELELLINQLKENPGNSRDGED